MTHLWQLWHYDFFCFSVCHLNPYPLHTIPTLTVFKTFLHNVNKEFNCMKTKGLYPHLERTKKISISRNAPMRDYLTKSAYIMLAHSNFPPWLTGKQDKRRFGEIRIGMRSILKNQSHATQEGDEIILKHKGSMKSSPNSPVGSFQRCFLWNWQRHQKWLLHLCGFCEHERCVSFSLLLSKVVESEMGLHYRIS